MSATICHFLLLIFINLFPSPNRWCLTSLPCLRYFCSRLPDDSNLAAFTLDCSELFPPGLCWPKTAIVWQTPTSGRSVLIWDQWFRHCHILWSTDNRRNGAKLKVRTAHSAICACVCVCVISSALHKSIDRGQMVDFWASSEHVSILVLLRCATISVRNPGDWVSHIPRMLAEFCFALCFQCCCLRTVFPRYLTDGMTDRCWLATAKMSGVRRVLVLHSHTTSVLAVLRFSSNILDALTAALRKAGGLL